MLPMIAGLALLQPPPHATQQTAPELERAALAVLADKCVQCHGPAVPHPKAAFGFVTDVPRLIRSDKYIVPGHPESSEIWKEIDEGDMPPDNAKAGALTNAEKQAIRDWIVALGAAQPMIEYPAVASSAPERAASTSLSRQGALTAPAESPPADGADRATPFHRAVFLLGRLHVVVLHFPIALLLAAASAVALSWVRRTPENKSFVRICLWAGALSAVLTAALGWIHAMDGFAGPLADPLSNTGLHRWIGTAVALLGPAAVWLFERSSLGGDRSVASRIAILTLAGLVALAGHFGGMLTHGSSFLLP